jgi:hypothetical protein
MEYITMNRKEREQSKVFEQVIAGKMTQAEAAAKLRITDRWVRIKIKRYRQDNDHGLVHKSRGRINSRRWNEKDAAFSLELLRSEWIDFGPTFAAEKLEQLHGIKISRETLRNRMIEAGIWIRKKRRMNHRKKRERRTMRGMMVQCDGSPHDWFEGRAGRCTLLVFIDDATSEILWLEFAASESLKSLMQATKNYIERYGIPQSFYTDHGSVFHVNLNNPEEDKKTQWERACEQLGITVIHAHSPQAKGRVERCNQTMQDRLIKEMRLAGIASIEEANNYLQTSNFIKNHNANYAVKAAQQGDAHRDHDAYNLVDIFSIQENRIIANDFTIIYGKRLFQIHREQKTIVRPKNEITVKMRLDGSIALTVRNVELFFSEINARPTPQKQEPKPCSNYIPRPSEKSKRWNSGPLSFSSKKTDGCSRVKPASPDGEAIINSAQNRNFSPCTKPELITLR